MEIKRWNQISGFFFPEEAEKLQELAKDKVCLEIGAFQGRSTTCLAEVAKTVYTVDTFRASGNGAQQVKGAPHEFTILVDFCTNIFRYTNIRVCIGLSHEIAKTFDNNSLDLILVDGSHEYEDVLLDIKSWWPKLKIDGIMAFHDYGLPTDGGWLGVFQAVNCFLTDRTEKILGIAKTLTWIKKETE